MESSSLGSRSPSPLSSILLSSSPVVREPETIDEFAERTAAEIQHEQWQAALPSRMLWGRGAFEFDDILDQEHAAELYDLRQEHMQEEIRLRQRQESPKARQREKRMRLVSNLNEGFDDFPPLPPPKHTSPPTAFGMFGRLPPEVRSIIYRYHFNRFGGIDIETDLITSRKHGAAVRSSGKHHIHLNVLRLNSSFLTEASCILHQRLVRSSALFIEPSFNVSWDHNDDADEDPKIVVDRRYGRGFEIYRWSFQPYKSSIPRLRSFDEFPFRALRTLRIHWVLAGAPWSEGVDHRYFRWDDQEHIGLFKPPEYGNWIARLDCVEEIKVIYEEQLLTPAIIETSKVAFEPFAALPKVKRYTVSMPTVRRSIYNVDDKLGTELVRAISNILKAFGKEPLQSRDIDSKLGIWFCGPAPETYEH